ncbi:hypothetical protein FCM35_KLT14211 [Carex littledalei]|uniref:CCHC-type domain-containing protein n=1 Tax=Carex littledalei TaxID=544730 RepID=A0A833QD36_9POAL|nr:hypothetical protein FCM35_KLT14211 [Carex littledalei]
MVVRSYSQVVQGAPNSSRGSASSTKSSPTSSPVNSRPSSPISPTSPKFFYSPHSPTKLRFPPLPTYPEWWGRCFNCCRLGHTASKCRNPKVCGKCWTTGHTARHCVNTDLNPAAPPFHPNSHQPQPQHTEPLFDDLLVGAFPLTPAMPEVHIRPVHWKRGAVYEASEFPKVPPKLTRPPPPPLSNPESPDTYLESLPARHDDSELVACSRRVLRELCLGVNPNKIPPAVRAVLNGDRNMAELSLPTLRELMQATDDQATDDRDAIQPPIPSYPTPLMLAATPKDTPSPHRELDASGSTIIRATTDLPSIAHRSREDKAKGLEVSPQDVSVQGTVRRIPNTETEAFAPQVEIACGDSVRSHQQITSPALPITQNTLTEGSQPILRRTKPIQTVTRHVSTTLKQSQEIVLTPNPESNISVADITPSPIPAPVSANPDITATVTGVTPPLNMGHLNNEAQQGEKRRVRNRASSRSNGPIKKSNQHAPPMAEINLSPSAHYEVQIQQPFGEQIVALCGVSTNDVFQALADDNTERHNIADNLGIPNEEPVSASAAPTEEEIRQSESRFQLDSEEDDSDTEHVC